MINIFFLGFALAASPGPDFFLILRHTLVYGRRIGYATLAGNRISLCLHISLAIFGLSAILKTIPILFTLVRFSGALYLIYLGIKNLTSKREHKKIPTTESQPSAITLFQAFNRGFLNNILNPKVSLFFLSIFPQVVSSENLSNSPLSIGLYFFIGNTLWWIPLIAILGFSKLRALILRFQKLIDLLFGILFVYFGLRIFVDEFLGVYWK